MTDPSPYVQADLGLDSNPQFQPPVIVAALRATYKKDLGAKQWLQPTARKQTSDAVSYNTMSDIQGSVDWITVEGGLPVLDQTGTKTTKIIRPFGAQFDITLDEKEEGDTGAVKEKIGDAVHAMRLFEDTLIMTRLLASAMNTFDATDWTAPATGKPVDDLAECTRRIKVATKGKLPTDLVYTALMEERLKAFDVVQNNTYLQSEVVKNGRIPFLGGLGLNTDEGVDSSDAGVAMVLTRGQMGFLAEKRPLTIVPVEGKYLGNPLIACRYFMFAQLEPVINKPELGCIMTGMKA